MFEQSIFNFCTLTAIDSRFHSWFGKKQVYRGEQWTQANRSNEETSETVCLPSNSTARKEVYTYHPTPPTSAFFNEIVHSKYKVNSLLNATILLIDCLKTSEIKRNQSNRYFSSAEFFLVALNAKNFARGFPNLVLVITESLAKFFCVPFVCLITK